MDTAPVNIIIPAWNLWETTRNCLLGLRKSTPAALCRVTVVDNGSSDDTAQMLQQLGDALFPNRFRRIRLPENLGFAVACNRGAADAQTPYLLFLNNDTLPRPGWLEPLLAAMETPDSDGKSAGVGPLLLYPENSLSPDENSRVQHCGIALTPTERFIHMYQHFPASHPAVRSARRWQALTAACLLVEREAFLACGGFFEGYLNGLEDIDLCARLAAQTGGSFRCVPESVVLHLESQTPGRNRADLENYALLKNRVFDAFTPDMQAIAEADGLRVVLSEQLEAFLGPAPDKLAELEALAASAHSLSDSTSELKSLLASNPAWQSGYALLAQALAAHGDPDAAEILETLRLEATLFPGADVLERLQTAAGKFNAPALRLYAARQLKNRRQMAANPQNISRAAEQYLARAARLGFNDVIKLLEDWLREHRP